VSPANLCALVRALVGPDKFRGSLSAVEAAEAIARGLRAGGVDEVEPVPLADGGEGTLDVLVRATGGSLRSAHATGPLGAPIDSAFALLPDGTAVVEMARVSGLALVDGANDPLRASTRGTGELIATAMRHGARRVVVAVGGSATTDGGLGAIEALGWSLRGHDVVVACDVTTPFLDAARVYGPQKGATAAQVELLSRRLQRLADQYEARTGVDVTVLEHAGAAGGLAGGLAALGAHLESGYDVVADVLSLDERLDGVDLVVTGEGHLDATSLEGKVVGGLLRDAAAAGVSGRAVIAGRVDGDARAALEEEGVVVRSLVERAFDAAESMDRAAVLLEEAAVEVARLLA
jgi:glycerate kinase